ncbi:alpha/beta hydrolase-fold protein [Flammeovirga sp. SJP92]|uniref:alpha/beta hydrolase-fold protein n=1 Tax=Flammeovirga sp. SJP92 TaxID=1775430 RepID=UPI00078746CB|nr:alpha/beta hydrolase-fold protein [Flammeovirga sp. SJP92]KXX70853.1 hypothetical protein AVL50_11470 [Flammeovirga sp. SJP92]
MKFHHIITPLLFFLFHEIKAQQSYTALTEQGVHILNEEDSSKYQQAYELFEKAFTAYPDSIKGTELFYASILNANMKNIDKAFEYLSPLSKMEKDEEGYPGWCFILEEFARSEYQNLIPTDRWKDLEVQARKDSIQYFETLKTREEEFFRTASSKGKNSYQSIRTYNPYLLKEERDYSIGLKINDSTSTSYHVHLPEHYNPKQKYPVLVFLHGGVRYSHLENYQITESNLGGWNRYYTKYGNRNDVILVFVSGSKQYNWMTSDDGFFMIPEIIRSIKTSINVDDNKVFISGHSNGATGSFSYLMKQPSLFAGFYGFNTQPKVFTGGTFIENASNRSFVNFSTDQDYYYPPNANDQLDSLMLQMQVDYKDYRYNGFPHWFPKFDESEPAYQILFEDLKQRNRNPFPRHISWEFDDDKYSSIDWISDIQLDTLQPKKPWQKEINFTIDKWLSYQEGNLIAKDVNKKAFDFPRKSGKIIADYENNVFHIKTSCIGAFKINISPEMIDLKKDIKVYVNGSLHFEGKVKYDKAFMNQNFQKNKDRIQVWVNQIELKV